MCHKINIYMGEPLFQPSPRSNSKHKVETYQIHLQQPRLHSREKSMKIKLLNKYFIDYGNIGGIFNISRCSLEGQCSDSFRDIHLD